MMGGTESSTGDEHMAMQKGSRTLTVQQEKGTDSSDIAFSIRENNQIFTDYGISHTKKMHFIIVRDDLRYFQHVHPVRDTQGIWHIDAKPTVAGTYWFYADFADKDGGSYALRFEKTYPGDKGAYGLSRNFETVKTVDGYRVQLKAVKNAVGDSTTLPILTMTYHVTDAKGNPVAFEEYLGAMGHSILISPTGDFIHMHAPMADNDPSFSAPLPGDSFYRAFTQFQIKGKVVTAVFDWQR